MTMTPCVSGSARNSSKQARMLEAVNGVSPDAHRRGLAKPDSTQLSRRLAGQRGRAREDADVPVLRVARRHDADLADARRENPLRIGADQDSRALLQKRRARGSCRGSEPAP